MLIYVTSAHCYKLAACVIMAADPQIAQRILRTSYHIAIFKCNDARRKFITMTTDDLKFWSQKVKKIGKKTFINREMKSLQVFNFMAFQVSTNYFESLKLWISR